LVGKICGWNVKEQFFVGALPFKRAWAFQLVGDTEAVVHEILDRC